MKKIMKISLSALAMATMVGCASTDGQTRTQCTSTTSTTCSVVPVQDEILISVVGYGAPHHTFETSAQRRIMALRASELDAYRKLAEQASGVHVFGDTRVDNFIARDDRVRSRLSAFVQGATITHQEYQDDGVAVTHMTMKVSRSQLQRMMEADRVSQSRGLGLVPGGAFPVR